MRRDLNPQQLAAVTHEGGPCLVLAGAGTGKTRVITYRVAWLVRSGVAPEAICAVTFTNKAAAEMRARVRGLLGPAADELWLLTFHALGLRLLRQAAGRPGAPRPGFAIYDRSDALAVWRGRQQELHIDPKEYPPAALFELCSRAVNRLEDPAAWDEVGRSFESRLAGRVYGAYRQELRHRNALDFDDLLSWPLRLLGRDEELRHGVRERFRHLLIDEYQDTNRLQYRLVRALLGPESSLMVVGDEDQAIYRWRGADLGNVLDFQGDFPGATVVRLEENYRSTSPILAAAGSLVGHNRERLGKSLWTQTPGGETPRFVLCGSERQEAAWVCTRIAAAIAEGVDPGEIAVLYRTNAQSRPFEEELAERAIPFRVVGGPTFFRRAEVKDLLAWLRLLIADDDAALARAAATPSRGVGPATLEKLAASGRPAAAVVRELGAGADPDRALRALGVVGRAARGLVDLAATLEELRACIEQVALPDLLVETMRRSGYEEMLRSTTEGQDRLANLDELVASAAEAAGEGGASDTAERHDALTRFLDRAALVSDADTARGARRGVALMTVHAAKGLEFHTVFLAGLEEGLLPHASSLRDGQIEEERRLCYVAMTRARRRLFLSAARIRRHQGRERLQECSRFVGELDAESLARSEDPAASAVAPAAQLVPGRSVLHPTFGPGRITAAEGDGDRLKVTVAFARAGSKLLLARFANLQLISPPRRDAPAPPRGRRRPDR